MEKKVNLNRTFARRVGKSLSGASKDVIENILPNYLLSQEKIQSAINSKQKIYLEIGFGMGEHLVTQAQSNQDSIYIGAEVYLNGVAKFLKLAKERSLTNFLLWPNDLDMLLTQNQEIWPPLTLSGIYILFPDPWPKNRHHKKRLFNEERLGVLKKLLKSGAFISFASDIEDYFNQSLNIVTNDGGFSLVNTSFLTPHEGYVQTKYHKKALSQGREAQFFTAIKL